MVRVTDIGKAVSYIIGGGVVSVIIEALTHLSPLYIFLTVIAYLLTIIVVTYMLIRFVRETEINQIEASILAEEDTRILKILNKKCSNATGAQKDLCEELRGYLETRRNAFSNLKR